MFIFFMIVRFLCFLNSFPFHFASASLVAGRRWWGGGRRGGPEVSVVDYLQPNRGETSVFPCLLTLPAEAFQDLESGGHWFFPDKTTLCAVGKQALQAPNLCFYRCRTMLSVVQTYELQRVNLWFGGSKPMLLMARKCKVFATRWQSVGCKRAKFCAISRRRIRDREMAPYSC